MKLLNVIHEANWILIGLQIAFKCYIINELNNK